MTPANKKISENQKLLTPIDGRPSTNDSEEALDPIIDVLSGVGFSPSAIEEKSDSPSKEPIQYHLKPHQRDAFLKKQRRCTYFNAQLDLVNFLDGVAANLKDHHPEHRREVLEKNLIHANAALPRGLYFPTNLKATDPHRSILRLIPESCRVLDSKDKCPYLLNAEVQINDHGCNDPNISDCLQPVKGSDMYVLVDGSTARLPSKEEAKARQAKIERELRDKEIGKVLKKMVNEESQEQRNRSISGSSLKGSPRHSSISPKGRTYDTNAPSPLVKPETEPTFKTGWKRQINNPWGKSWRERIKDYRKASPVGNKMRNWSVQSVIFKAGDDLRQEALAMQLICLFDCIFKESKIPIQLTPNCIQVTSPTSGFVETIPDTINYSNLKKDAEGYTSLAQFWEAYFGPRGSPSHDKALNNFVESLAGYSLVCYFLQIKDRHNGNIMFDRFGRIVHIDFGFMLSNSPGGNLGFETAPFKFQEDFITLLGGETDSEAYNYYRILMLRGFIECRRHIRKFKLLCQIMLWGSSMPCFFAGQQSITDLENRFLPNASQEQVVEHVINLIEISSCNWRTQQYDSLQRITNGIL